MCQSRSSSGYSSTRVYASVAPSFTTGHICTRVYAPIAPPSRQDTTAVEYTHPSPPPPPPETSLTPLEQKLMVVDARLQTFINESRETKRRRDEQYDLIMSLNSQIMS
ncbi:hypothetical protein ACOSQ4_030544 [Xanthoceras sorbifolium]